MHVQALSAQAAGERLRRALPGLPTRDSTGLMPPEPPADVADTGRNVWLELSVTSAERRSAARWYRLLEPLANVAPLEPLCDPENASELRLRMPLLSLSRQFALSSTSAPGVFGVFAKIGATTGVRVHPSLRLAEAVERSVALARLVMGRNAEIDYVLRPDRTPRLSMKSLFDALLGLGFVWGDGDLFFWPARGCGGRVTVGTSSPPGYFLPEEAARGGSVGDVLFHLYAPLSTAPITAHAAMVAALTELAEKLHGALSGTDSEPFDPASDRAVLQQIVSDLEAAGLAPGSPQARAVF